MYCTNCGSQINDNAVICPHCGVQVGTLQPSAPVIPPTAPVTSNMAPVAPNTVYVPMPYAQKRPENTLAIVGFILAFFIPLAGLICSIIGYGKVKKEGAANGGLAIAGIVISAVIMGIILLYIFIYLFMFLMLFAAVIDAPAVSALLFI